MTEPSDPFWDELGIAWSAIDPNIRVIASKLEVRLRRQSAWMSGVVVIGLLCCAMGVLLGIGTIGIGTSSGAWNFVTRGVALIAISATLIFPLWSLRPIRSLDTTSALAQMIDLAIERAQKTLSLTRACLYSCVIATAFGFVGTAIRTHLGRHPKMSPIVDLVIVGLIALALLLYGRQIKVGLGKYRALRQALGVDAEAAVGP